MPKNDPNNRPAQRNGKPSICFVALKAYGVLSGREDIKHIGGAEVQQTLIARELVKRGYPVSFVVLDHGQPDGIEHDGIRTYKSYSPESGWPGLRFVHPRWTGIRRAMSRASANIFFQRAAGSETGQVELWCRTHRKPFVFAAGSETDCDRNLPYLDTWRDRVLYRYGLKSAASVIAQTQLQVRRFREEFGIESVLIRSCSADPTEQTGESRPTGRPRMLWVGRFATEKRPEMLLDLAEACSECDFDVVGATNGAGAYGEDLERRAARLTNVTLHGRVAHRDMGQHYDRATLLICTSMWEGYPNTFLEAWARGVPIVSTVDPDDAIATGALGKLGETVPELTAAIRTLHSDGQQRTECSQRARRFFSQNHTIATAADAYDDVIAKVSRA